MKPNLPFHSAIFCLAAAAIMMVCVSFVFKNTSTIYTKNKFPAIASQPQVIQPVIDLTEFEVKSIDLNKLSVSFYYNQEQTIFIKIYDVIGNIVHQEKVRTKGRFKKEYSLTGAKTEIYIVEVGNKKGSTTKRVFMI